MMRVLGAEFVKLRRAPMLLWTAFVVFFISALDLATDARLRAALHKQTADATVIIVAQRVGTIMRADQIIVLDDDGTIAGIGTHDDLLETSETYREIVTSQLGVEGAA